MHKFADRHQMFLAHDKTGICYCYLNKPVTRTKFHVASKIDDDAMYINQFDTIPFDNDDWKTIISPTKIKVEKKSNIKKIKDVKFCYVGILGNITSDDTKSAFPKMEKYIMNMVNAGYEPEGEIQIANSENRFILIQKVVKYDS